MKNLIMFSLLCVSAGAAAEPEWQIIFPNQAGVIDGHYIDHNQGLLIKTAGGLVVTEGFDLALLTGLDIPDNVAVTGFTFKDQGGNVNYNGNYLFSLSASTGDYIRGDVIDCNYQGCTLYEAFGDKASISGLDFNDFENELYVAFDTGLSRSGFDLSPINVYKSSDNSIGFDGLDYGLGDNNAISAFDISESDFTTSSLRMYETVDGLIKASEAYSTTVNSENSVTAELADQVNGINAYYALDSGWLEFDGSVINIPESVGTFSFAIARVDGLENNTAGVISMTNGSAIAGVDFTPVNGTYFWTDGLGLDRVVDVSLIDNNVIDGTRTFTINLSESTDNFIFSLVNPNKNQITVNILDDDAGDLIFADGFEL